jgi:CubicO group peptidase (beta-lactamase class C family)
MAEMVEVHGWTTSEWQHVAETWHSAFGTGDHALGDRGSSLSIFYRGIKVIDLWGGHTSPPPSSSSDTLTHWTDRTVVNVFSCTKAMANLCLVLLRQRKAFDWSDRVSKALPNHHRHGSVTR